MGQASCGCFGAVKMSPWYTLGLDAGVLVLLAVLRPDPGERAEAWRSLPRLIRYAVGVAVLAGAFLGVSRIWFASPQEALAFLRGERITVDRGRWTSEKGKAENGRPRP